MSFLTLGRLSLNVEKKTRQRVMRKRDRKQLFCGNKYKKLRIKLSYNKWIRTALIDLLIKAFN